MRAGYLHAALGGVHMDAEIHVRGPDGFVRLVEALAVEFDPNISDANGDEITPLAVLTYNENPEDERVTDVRAIAVSALDGKKTAEELRQALRKILKATEAET